MAPSRSVTLAVVTAIVIVTTTFPEFTVGLFTDEVGVLALAGMYLRIFAAHFICSAIISAFQAMVIGSGNASLNFIVGMLDGIVCKVGLGILFAYVMEMGYRGFFIGTGALCSLTICVEIRNKQGRFHKKSELYA